MRAVINKRRTPPSSGKLDDSSTQVGPDGGRPTALCQDSATVYYSSPTQIPNAVTDACSKALRGRRLRLVSGLLRKTVTQIFWVFLLVYS